MLRRRARPQRSLLRARFWELARAAVAGGGSGRGGSTARDLGHGCHYHVAKSVALAGTVTDQLIFLTMDTCWLLLHVELSVNSQVSHCSVV